MMNKCYEMLRKYWVPKDEKTECIGIKLATSNFESKVRREFMELLGIKKTGTNVEMYNRTIRCMSEE